MNVATDARLTAQAVARTRAKIGSTYLTLRGLSDPAASSRRHLIESAEMWALGMFNDENDPATMFEELRWDEIIDAARSDRNVWRAFMAWQQYILRPMSPAAVVPNSLPTSRTFSAVNGQTKPSHAPLQKVDRTPRRGAVSI